MQDHGGYGHRNDELHPERPTGASGVPARIGFVDD
jgi:hypothetical protein